MIWLLILAVYLLGWFPTAVKVTQVLGVRARCHGRVRWDREGDCRYYHPQECWHAGQTNVIDVAQACLVALMWPVVVLGFGVHYFAVKPSKKPVPRVLSERELAHLELEAGLKPKGVEGIDY